MAVWVAVLLTAGTLSARYLSGALSINQDFTNNPESKRAQALLEQRLRGPRTITEFVIVRSADLRVDDAEYRAFVEGLIARISALGPGVVERVGSFYSTGSPVLVSADGHSTLVTVLMAGSFDRATEQVQRVHEVTIDAPRTPGFDVLEAGDATLSQDFRFLAEGDLRKGELLGLPFALVVLVVVFGALVSAVLPIALGILAIGAALGAVALLGRVFDFAFFVVNMVTMMGLAVGIDYSLFIVSRYREERRRGREKMDAIGVSAATASRAVFFSGTTVVIALAGMLVLPTTTFRSIAAGAILVVVAAVAAALTLLPAMLGLLGDRVDALRIPLLGRRARAEARGGFWDRTTGAVIRKPVTSIVLAAGLLIAASLSLFNLRTGFSGVSTLPDSVQSKRAFLALARDFSGGIAQPAEIVIDGPASSPKVLAAIERLRATLAADAAFGPAAVQTNPAGDLALVSASLRSDPSSEQAAAAIRRLRGEIIPAAFAGAPARVLVGGQTAIAVDFFSLTRAYTPFVFAFVLGLSFLLLMVVFRSLVVPVKAIIMNLLSVGAAYGLVVLVFQEGHGAGLLGFQRVEVVEAWLPLFLFSILFGLSMDYHVFLLSRIRERYGQTGDNSESVAFGVRTTAGIITGAALIMVAVFGAFAAGELVMLQQVGFGLAVAVFLDATVVRSVLVPASMRLLGSANWYLPSWLQWLPKIHVDGAAAKPRTVVVSSEPSADRPRTIDLTEGTSADRPAIRRGARRDKTETPRE